MVYDIRAELGIHETTQLVIDGMKSTVASPDYMDARDRPDIFGTSRLSPHLHFGEISPRQVRHFIEDHLHHHEEPGLVAAAESWLRQLAWREFGHHLLWHFPETAEQPMDRRFGEFPWRENPAGLRAWQSGQTGIPLVDAGMRELWATGWMHNRVRMVAASLLGAAEVEDVRVVMGHFSGFCFGRI